MRRDVPLRRRGCRNPSDFANLHDPVSCTVIFHAASHLHTILDKFPPQAPYPRVLIVDDNTDAADSLGAFLSILGCTVEVTYSGAEALFRGDLFLPQLVILDIEMPLMDGCETARRMRARPWGGSLCIAALTAWNDADLPCCPLQEGMDFHLIKPVGANALLDILAAVRA